LTSEILENPKSVAIASLTTISISWWWELLPEWLALAGMVIGIVLSITMIHNQILTGRAKRRLMDAQLALAESQTENNQQEIQERSERHDFYGTG